MVKEGKVLKILSDKPIYLDIAEFDGETDEVKQDYFNFVELVLANEIKI